MYSGPSTNLVIEVVCVLHQRRQDIHTSIYVHISSYHNSAKINNNNNNYTEYMLT